MRARLDSADALDRALSHCPASRVSERYVRVLGQNRSTQRRLSRDRDDERQLTDDIVALARRYGSYTFNRISDSGAFSLSCTSAEPASVIGLSLSAPAPKVRSALSFAVSLWCVSSQLAEVNAFGERIASRDPDRQAAKVQIRVAPMNRLNALGIAEIERVA
ncbi:hypothetical protein PDE01_28960 [Paracoccus denitrificans]|nr:hypothetical protein PDE01_28960 [Paracoccus denitrificans]